MYPKQGDQLSWLERYVDIVEVGGSTPSSPTTNYEKYKYFVNKNFATKSIAYGLIGENIINNSSENELSVYLNAFTDYLIKTIYKLANSNSSSSIVLKDVDIKDDIYIIKSEISDEKSSANLYWKVIDTGSSYKIIDVIVENTSYFVTKKSEFNKILRKNRGSLEALVKEIAKI